jgi:hypothetical protein
MVGTWLLWKKKEKEVAERLSLTLSEPKEAVAYMTDQAIDVETVQYIENEVGHVAPGATSTKVCAIPDWALSNHPQSPQNKETTGKDGSAKD